MAAAIPARIVFCSSGRKHLNRRIAMPSPFRFFLLLALCFFLSACSRTAELAGRAASRINGPDERAFVDLAAVPTVYVSSRIYRGDMQVLVHPNINLDGMPTALFVPLGVTQEMADGARVSRGVSRQIWQQFLRHGTFSVLEMADMRPPYRAETALPLARQLGADMLVGGYITYYLDGGTSGDSKISLQLEVYGVNGGEMLWSVAHAALLPRAATRDFLVAEVRNRVPADPMAALVAAVGSDMAELLHMWTDPEGAADFAAQREAGDAGDAGRSASSAGSAFGRF